MNPSTLDHTRQEVLDALGIKEKSPVIHTGLEGWHDSGQPYLSIHSPADGQLLGSIQMATEEKYDMVVSAAQEGFAYWREIPAPQRGEIVRQIGDALRRHKEPLGKLVSLEMGKIYQEGLGEVQEMIDICDFAVGQSRMMYGKTMQSERYHHRMMEQWHPLGPVGVISAFNFPVAVWAWNAMIAAVCGNTVIWKPSEKTPLTAVACQNIISEVLAANELPAGIFNLIVGGRDIGQKMAADSRLPLISATGSTRMGKAVAQTVAARLGKTVLELGGNNAIIITQHANMQLVVPAVVFGSVGTAGQRCTSTRRLLIEESIYDEVKEKLVKAYGSLKGRIGHPLDEKTLIGPLIDLAAVETMQQALGKAKQQGGTVLFGGEVLSGEGYQNGQYVVPAIVEAQNEYEIVQSETFAPILYLIKVSDLAEAVRLHNDVPQGLSSAIFTENMKEAEYFLSHLGSDCGIANVNIGTSGAEIGGAFGGEKETGGGRESGSDAWRGYMRRQTNTLNWSDDLPLAQGIKFDV